MRKTTLVAGICLAVFACKKPEDTASGGPSKASQKKEPAKPPPLEKTVGEEKIVPPVAAEKAPPASERLADDEGIGELASRIESHFQGRGTHRIYIQVDKPIYKPGETIWIKTWDLALRDHNGGPAPSITYELINPRGSRVEQKQVQQVSGRASNDLQLSTDSVGGQYTLKVQTSDGVSEERPVVVSVYEAPRIKKELEFLRKAYGPGDEVKATVTVKRPTGEVLAQKTLKAVVNLDGETLTTVNVVTNEHGGAVVAFNLPGQMDRGDGLLTVMVEDGGITESVSKSIPIVLKKLQLSIFPEGGDLVAGLRSRLYFEAKTPIGKPADIEGNVVDDQGQVVARLQTYHFGLGRTEFVPSPGRSYHVEVTKPADITAQFPVPVAREDGCVLRAYDDFDGQVAALRVAVSCNTARKVYVTASTRENHLDAAAVQVDEVKSAVVYLSATDPKLGWARGVARVTVFDENRTPLAERLVFRNRRRGLRVSIETDEKEYTPRDQVALTVKTSDADGKPVPAEIALSVVDDTVVAFADDKTGHMESRLLLEQEIPDKLEEPKFFFDLKKEKSAQALDFLMGTRGYRRFDWQPVWNDAVALGKGGGAGLGIAGVATGGAGRDRVRRNNQGQGKGGVVLARQPAPAPADMAMGEVGVKAAPAKKPMRAVQAMAEADEAVPAAAAPEMALAEGAGARAVAAARPAGAPIPEPAAPPAAPRVQAPQEAQQAPARAEKKKMAMPEPMQEAVQNRPVAKLVEREAVGRKDDALAGFAKRDMALDDMRGAKEELQAVAADPQPVARERRAVGFAPVRVFPAPTYTGAFSGVRTDFRETVHWAPAVQTDSKGKAIVTFYLSDAVTSFRVFAEGSGGGGVGREEKTFKSSLPFSMSVKLPLEVSAGDSVLVPLTLSNERDKDMPLALEANFGALEATGQVGLEGGVLSAGSRQSLFFPVNVTAQAGSSAVSFAATAGGLKDEFIREINIVPLGFPQEFSESGEVAAKATATITFDTGEALPGTANAKVTLYPSPTATLLSGLDGMIREPYGCFEQTSSANYPNVMVLDYLRTQRVTDAQLVGKVQGMLERGYNTLVGFETKEKGYEWFGQAPGHEALTAYGVLEFADMKRAWGGVDQGMVTRTVAYLKGKRDGKGGFQRNDRALDSFGRADPAITDAYIIYAMTEAGFTDFDVEIEGQAEVARTSDDPYLLALATNTLLNVRSQRGTGIAAAKRLAGLQETDGHWAGKLHSITRSTGQNLNVETTSLALMALLKGGGFKGETIKGAKWLVRARQGHGDWGATQATVLALKAVTAYTIKSRNAGGGGTIELRVNGKTVGEPQRYQPGRKESLTFTELGAELTAGTNTIEIVHDGKVALPYSVAVDYRSTKPASHPETVVDLQTTIATTELKMGDNVRVTAILTNKTQQGQPMTLARIGLPGGLTFQNWQLKELMEKKIIDFYETRAREVIVYLRQMAPGETKEIPLDLVAMVPGTYTGPASSAYLYYTDDQKVWIAPLKVTIKN